MNELNRCKPLLGTYVEVSLTADLSDFELISLSNRLFERISDVQTQMSFHDSQSILSQINNLPLDNAIDLGDDYVELFAVISELHSCSDGYFDPSIAASLVQAEILPSINGNAVRPSEMTVTESASWQDLELANNQLIKRKALMVDLGGIAKGYAVDKAIELVPDRVEACVNAGGDLRFTHWQTKTVGIKHSRVNGESSDLQTSAIDMLAPAVATTSAYYQDGISHVVNPKSGVLQNDVRTYSVFAPSCVLADGLTKLACLLHAENTDKLNDILTAYNATLIVMD